MFRHPFFFLIYLSQLKVADRAEIVFHFKSANIYNDRNHNRNKKLKKTQK